MSLRHALFFTTLLGCTSPATTVSDGATTRAPLPATMNLDISPLVPGETIEFEITGAAPGAEILMLRAVGGTIGQGICPGLLQGQCLDIQGRISIFPYMYQADAQGRVAFSVTLPASVARGTSVAFQAIDLDAVTGSNPVLTTVEDTTGCVDDRFEDNDSLATAIDGPTVTTSLRSCQSDDDYYRYEVAAGETLRVDFAFDHTGDGDLDATLLLDDGTVLDQSVSTTDTETLQWTNSATRSRDVYVRAQLYADAGPTGIDYTIAAQWTGGGNNGSAPVFEDDCTQQLNDTLADATELDPATGTTWDVALCSGEQDWYTIDVAPGTWTSLAVQIQGTGAGSTDLDLYETNAAGDTLQSSISEQSYERLAVYNDTNTTKSFTFVVSGYASAAADYDLVVETSPWHEGPDCDAFYPTWSPTNESGPCNQIMQFPRSYSGSDALILEHEPHYSNLRREMAYLVSYAAMRTAQLYPNANPIGLLDMSQADGDTPGRMVNDLRHPEGTHVSGNDIDIAYFQTGPDNLGRPVCPHDGYFCTATPDTLDAEVTTYFMAQLFTSNHVRVIGVDTEIAPLLEASAEDLYAAGLITATQRNSFTQLMAWGSGWPFHHHHLHLSWDWESGW